MVKDGEIVGLKASNNGRSCEMHDCCGAHVYPDDLVRFKLACIDIDGKTEEAIKVVCVRDGTESCTVGFLPRNIVRSAKDSLVGKFAQVIELYKHSENPSMRRKGYRNCGIASYRLLKSIQEQE